MTSACEAAPVTSKLLPPVEIIGATLASTLKLANWSDRRPPHPVSGGRIGDRRLPLVLLIDMREQAFWLCSRGRYILRLRQRLHERTDSGWFESFGNVRLGAPLARVHFAESLRNAVKAAAENTNIFATMTGDAFISTPYITQSNAPNIWTPRSSDGRTQKYDPTNTAVAPHPKYSVPE
jgi:hypothetical protein